MNLLSISFISFITLCMITFATILWWIVRKEKRRLWFPILRVVRLDKKNLPHLQWMHPPWLSFFCFAIACAAIAVYTFMPTEVAQKQERKELRHTHVFFDLSPSVNSEISIENYRKHAAELLDSMAAEPQATFSFSSDPTLRSIEPLSLARRFLQEMSFHRAGLKIGSAIDEILKISPDIEHIIIVSDKAQSSWEDFNWRYLEKKVHISMSTVSSPKAMVDNIFFGDIKRNDGFDSKADPSWTLTIRRTGIGSVIEGVVEVTIDNRLLAEKKWSMSEGMHNIDLEMQVSKELILDALNKPDSYLMWSIKSSSKSDMSIDNTFRTLLESRWKEAYLVAQPQGEMFLDDSVFHLKSSLEVLGFDIKRLDQWPSKWSGTHSMPPLIVSEVGPASPISRFCPLTLLQDDYPKERQVWLIPAMDLRNYGDMCHCFSTLIGSSKKLGDRPAYCNNLETRDQWVSVMRSIGAQQLGGNINDPLGAIAMSFKNQKKSLLTMGFTVPLQPRSGDSLSFGKLPLIIREILSLFPVHGTSAIDGVWTRVSDIVKERGVTGLEVSNVPFLESVLKNLADDQLPPLLEMQGQKFIRSPSSLNQQRDAQPWIRACLRMLLCAIWIEVLALSIRYLGGSKLRSKHLWLIALLSIFCTTNAPAQVRLNLLGFPKFSHSQVLKRDISSRTSIEFDEKINQSSSYSKTLLEDPWIWAASATNFNLLDKDGWADLIGWLQKGGFLIIERSKEALSLKKRIIDFIPRGDWKPIPPDHELMRSFHLLASLPKCDDLVWEGFHFDDRISIVLIPDEFLTILLGEKSPPSCYGAFSREQALRIFINLQMVALATDYKKDQIHLPEILKRLR